jgi:predicted DNA-binding protein
MNLDKTSKQIAIRLTDEMYKRLSAEASMQTRPLANYIKAVLVEHLETLDRPKKIAELK